MVQVVTESSLTAGGGWLGAVVGGALAGGLCEAVTVGGGTLRPREVAAGVGAFEGAVVGSIAAEKVAEGIFDQPMYFLVPPTAAAPAFGT